MFETGPGRSKTEKYHKGERREERGIKVSTKSLQM